MPLAGGRAAVRGPRTAAPRAAPPARRPRGRACRARAAPATRACISATGRRSRGPRPRAPDERRVEARERRQRRRVGDDVAVARLGEALDVVVVDARKVRLHRARARRRASEIVEPRRDVQRNISPGVHAGIVTRSISARSSPALTSPSASSPPSSSQRASPPEASSMCDGAGIPSNDEHDVSERRLARGRDEVPSPPRTRALRSPPGPEHDRRAAPNSAPSPAHVLRARVPVVPRRR